MNLIQLGIILIFFISLLGLIIIEVWDKFEPRFCMENSKFILWYTRRDNKKRDYKILINFKRKQDGDGKHNSQCS